MCNSPLYLQSFKALLTSTSIKQQSVGSFTEWVSMVKQLYVGFTSPGTKPSAGRSGVKHTATVGVMYHVSLSDGPV